MSSSRALPPRWLPQCSCVVIESSFDPGERLQAPGSLWLWYQVFHYGVVSGTFTLLKWSLVPPDFKQCCIRYSWKLFQILIKVLPVNSEVMVDLKNIESPVVYVRHCSSVLPWCDGWDSSRVILINRQSMISMLYCWRKAVYYRYTSSIWSYIVLLKHKATSVL